jgi:hypothetical protein
VTDENNLRQSLRTHALDFADAVHAVASSPSSEWWVSRFRLDLVVGANGAVAAVPFINAGGELRLRFEWNRISPTGASPAPVGHPIANLPARNQKLQQLVMTLSNAVQGAAAATQAESGWMPYGFRVGVGVTVGGNIGIAKGSAQVIGQLYFNRAVRKPPINPAFAAALAAAPQELSIVEGNAPARHIEFAKAAHLDVQTTSAKEAIYIVPVQKIQDGLKKAFKISHFFTKQAKVSKPGKWNVFELKTGFDFTLAGSVGLATVTGTVTTEVFSYNEAF